MIRGENRWRGIQDGRTENIQESQRLTPRNLIGYNLSDLLKTKNRRIEMRKFVWLFPLLIWACSEDATREEEKLNQTQVLKFHCFFMQNQLLRVPP